jgi:hypothetical protein
MTDRNPLVNVRGEIIRIDGHLVDITHPENICRRDAGSTLSAGKDACRYNRLWT